MALEEGGHRGSAILGDGLARTLTPFIYPWTQWFIYTALCDPRVPVTCSIPILPTADDVRSPKLPHDDPVWQPHNGMAGVQIYPQPLGFSGQQLDQVKMIVQDVVSQCTLYAPHTPTADDRPSLLPNNGEECNDGGYLSCTGCTHTHTHLIALS